MNRLLVSALAISIACADALARAQAAAPTAAPAPGPGAATDAQKAEARAHFEKGLALFEEEAWDAALAEFVQSRSLFPTRAATKDAAICLRKLHRFDEAADMFDALLRDFPTLPADERALANAQSQELSGFVGTISIVGAEPGSKVVIDGRDRGETPVAALRVAAGTHVLRVVHEGFAPLETQFSVAGRQAVSVTAKLSPLLQGGRLHVEEASGAAAQVFIDGAAVGKTPWDGLLPVGEHVVTLQGEGNLGTQPALVSVKLNGTTQLSLRDEPLQATLHVKPNPAAASVILDGVPVGRGAWSGRVRGGSHALEVRAEGYVTDLRRTATPADRETSVEITLRGAAAAGSAPGRVFIEADGAFALAPSWGGELVSSCRDACKAGKPLGFEAVAHAGYELASGLGFGLDIGFVSLTSDIKDRDVALRPQGLAANPGVADDALRLSGLRLGPSGQFHHGEKLVINGRLGAGVMLGSLKDQRKGTASTVERTDPASGADYPAQDYSFNLSESASASYLYVAPELRAGVRLSKNFELTAGLRALVLLSLSQPKWADKRPVSPGADYHVGQLRFGADALTGGVLLVLAPGLGARFDF